MVLSPLGNVIFVDAVDVSVIVCAPEVANVEPSYNARFAPVNGCVIATLLILVAVAIPIIGVDKVGLVANTTLPVPVLVVTPVPPFATGSVPDTCDVSDILPVEEIDCQVADVALVATNTWPAVAPPVI